VTKTFMGPVKMIEPCEVIDTIMAMAEEGKRLLTSFEMIDGPTLAERWKLKPGWVRKQTGALADPLPHVKLGRYVRFLWDSPELNRWLLSRYRR
jgi:hypothetical protein